MNEDRKKYKTPFEERYASKEMLYIFSDMFKFTSWRKLWVALAEEEKRLGLQITDEQIQEMRANIENIDFQYAKEKEKELRHDVMAHIHAFARLCPKAAPIIHLGATSAYVGDNTDLIQIKEGLALVCKKLFNVINILMKRALENNDVTTLAFTHFQSAQPTTVGKRITLYVQDFIDSFTTLMNIKDSMRFLGVKGTTGTQASFLTLFKHDADKVRELDTSLAKKFGFENVYAVSGQTYPRRFDSEVCMALSLLSLSIHKMATDMRLLAHMKEIDEPFESSQIGSSAMAYKRNPMRSERICSLARFVSAVSHSLETTAATQWFERTLDDSACKRLAVPQAFLAVDSILQILINISNGFVVNKKVIEKNLMEELPFMITESILMKAVEKGCDRQNVHERIRVLSLKVMKEIKEDGASNKLFEYIAGDKEIGVSEKEIKEIIETENVSGMSKVQVFDFEKKIFFPLKEKYKCLITDDCGDIKV